MAASLRFANFAAFQDAVVAEFAEFTAQEQLLAQAILRRPSDVAVMSMRRFAAEANVSPFTAIRLFKKLGLSSYDDIRALALDALREDPAAAIERARAAAPDGGDMLASQLALVVAAIKTPSQADLDRVARVLKRAKVVYVLGLRTSQALARHFYYCGQHVHKNLLFLSGESGLALDTLANIGREDVVFALSFRPYAALTLRLCQYARGRGARIVAVTDNKLSPLHRLADESLFVAADGPSYFNSLVGPIIVVERLLARMHEPRDETAADRRKRVQALHHYLDRGRA